MAVRDVFSTTLADIIQETPRVRTFRLALPSGSPFSFKAGQFVMASIPDFLNQKGRPVRRAYSVASSPKDLEKGYLELTITRVGEGGLFSNRIHEALPGDTVLIDGPYGSFVLQSQNEPQPSRYVFVASGSGIAPLRGMIRTILLEGRKVPIELLYGFRHRSDYIYERELSGYVGTVSDFSLVTSLSQGTFSVGEDDALGKDGSFGRWKRMVGRITTLLPDLVPEVSDSRVYICGPPEMVGQTDFFFREIGFPEGSVHKEQW
ncbi:MAG: FAD-binding oxidoreductase [Leptospirales bacterium]